MRFALAKGASKVYVIDTVPARLALAAKAGPKVVTVDFKTEDVCKFILGETPKGLDGESCIVYERVLWF